LFWSYTINAENVADNTIIARFAPNINASVQTGSYSLKPGAGNQGVASL